MGYVMLPVPEEHVEVVMQFILREMARAALEPWDAESIAQTYEQVDEATRSLLAFVARATLRGADLSDAEAASKIQMTVRETAGITNELMITAREASRPSLISPRLVTQRLPNGRTTDKRILAMEQEVAELVRAVEEAELQAVPHPLGGSST